jgi:hypothetical protein
LTKLGHSETSQIDQDPFFEHVHKMMTDHPGQTIQPLLCLIKEDFNSELSNIRDFITNFHYSKHQEMHELRSGKKGQLSEEDIVDENQPSRKAWNFFHIQGISVEPSYLSILEWIQSKILFRNESEGKEFGKLDISKI